LAIVKEKKVVFSSTEKGIKPLFKAVMENKEVLKDSSIADRVTGKAAAMICVFAEVKIVHTKILSENAVEAFLKSPILYECEESTPYIKNRDKTGMCPIEKLSLDTDDINILLSRISNFLDNLGR
jgi:hypothetical protein